MCARHELIWPGWRYSLSDLKRCPTWVSYLTGTLCFGWFFLASYSDWLVESIVRYLPGWLATVVFASPLLILPAILVLSMPKYLEVLFGVLALVSFLLLPVAAHFHSAYFYLIVGLEFIEMYWLIPQWETRRSR